MNDHELWHEAERLLTKEARLLDERRLEEWVELFTEDVLYWMPARENREVVSNPLENAFALGEFALFEETKPELERRIKRLRTGVAWGEEPPSRTRHLVTNIEVEATENPSEFHLFSNFLVYRTQVEHDMDIWVGRRDDVVRRVNGELKIARRTVWLDQTVLFANNLSVFF